MNKTNKIITGCNGFIGKNFILLNNLHNYLGIDKKKVKEIKSIKVNLSKKTFPKNINDSKIKYLFHFAGYSNLDYKNNFDKCFKEDYASLINIIKFLKNNKVKNTKLIYSSSSYVYQNLNKKIAKEDDNLNPKNPFGISKLFFENVIKYHWSNHLIFRICSVFGNNFVTHPNIINQLHLMAEKHSVINIWGSGTRKLQFIEINDLVKNIYKNKNLKGIYNIGLNNNLSTKKISQIISKSNNKKIKINYLKHKPQAETLPLMSIDKIEKNSLEIKKINLEEQIMKFCEDKNVN